MGWQKNGEVEVTGATMFRGAMRGLNVGFLRLWHLLDDEGSKPCRVRLCEQRKTVSNSRNTVPSRH